MKEKYNLTEKTFLKLQKSFKFKPERQIVVCIIVLLPKSKQNVNVQTEMHLKEKMEIAKTNTPFILNEVDVIYLGKCICLKSMKIYLLNLKHRMLLG